MNILMNNIKCWFTADRTISDAGNAQMITGIVCLFIFTSTGCEKFQIEKSGSQNRNVSTQPASVSQSAPSVVVMTVEKQDLVNSIEMPGTVEGYETVDLYAKVGGYLKTYMKDKNGDLIDIGSPIKKDQELAKLFVPEMDKNLAQKKALIKQSVADADQSKEAIRQAEAEVTSAQAAVEAIKSEKGEKDAQVEFRQADFRRISDLARSGSVRGELLDAAKFQRDAAISARKTVQARIRSAEANLNAIKVNLDKAKADLRSVQARGEVSQANLEYVQTMMQYTTIKSPFDGVVTKRHVHSGAFIQPAEGNSAAKPLLQVTRSDIVRIFLDIPMTKVRWLNKGDRAVLNRINVLPEKTFEGNVSRFSPILDKNSRMMRIEVDLSNQSGELRPGFYGYVTVYLDESPQTPVIPSSALLSTENEKFVYLVENNQIKKQPVTINYEDGSIIGITSGLKGGELIVRSGGSQLSEGQQVAPVMSN